MVYVWDGQSNELLKIDLQGGKYNVYVLRKMYIDDKGRPSFEFNDTPMDRFSYKPYDDDKISFTPEGPNQDFVERIKKWTPYKTRRGSPPALKKQPKGCPVGFDNVKGSCERKK
jgi:hypothetical protein